MKYRILIIGVALALLCSVSASAQKQKMGGKGNVVVHDFSFAVPVQIKGLPKTYTAKVSCTVKSLVKGPNPFMAYIGFGQTPVNIVNGTFDSKVVVSVDASKGMDANDATDYECDLEILHNGKLELPPKTKHNLLTSGKINP